MPIKGNVCSLTIIAYCHQKKPPPIVGVAFNNLVKCLFLLRGKTFVGQSGDGGTH